ncbi:hypothetical protein Ga0080574_TMP1126 [Salipiger abyssi]|uniref:Uncharacterized protein n=1 Tax=Salipiger abyssi TaxID=1250539 RepID=A0A1P8UPZ7_9RHOB|nr:hypothetical protein Ga0080574_TMP1126 [Salipiger abyssi]
MRQSGRPGTDDANLHIPELPVSKFSSWSQIFPLTQQIFLSPGLFGVNLHCRCGALPKDEAAARTRGPREGKRDAER